MKTFEFEKRGINFKIEVEGTSCTMKVEELVLNTRPGNHPKAGWHYKVKSPELYKKLTGQALTKEIYLTNSTAEQVAELIEEAKEQEREIVRNSELTFKVEEAIIDRDWGMTSLVLVEQKELLSKEQREQVRELKALLGETALFAGATKHINAEELPVKEGQKITLTEILEMVKETKKYQKKEEEEKAEEKRIDEAKEEARKTGENIKINSYTAPCNDPNEECSTDIITEYMTPSGRVKTTRTHTY